MNFKKIFSAIFLSFTIQLQVFSQQFPQDYFKNPLNINMLLSGTFAELRGNHFHSGVDIKTNQEIGLEVLATASGYVSRIKISSIGYGKALYITHPNGYTTVYAHLDHFNSFIDSIAKKEQYVRESFEMDYFPQKGLINVEQGQIIAYSGNSGSSGGPHLHYEIRDKEERPLNPMLFGFGVSDSIKPEINSIRVYNFFDNQPISSKIIRSSKTQNYNTFNDTIITYSTIYIGVNAIDMQSDKLNSNGIYSMIIRLDSQIIYKTNAEKIDFLEQRYVNAYIDYKTLFRFNTYYQVSRLLPGNKFSFYKTIVNNGIIELSDTLIHHINIEVSDFENNTAFANFCIKGTDTLSNNSIPKPLFQYNKTNKFSIADAKITIPSGCLYTDIFFNIRSLKNYYTPYSPLIEFGNPEVPLHSYTTISIKTNSQLSPKYFSKVAIASIDNDRNIIYEGGDYVNGWVTTKTRSFGNYFITVDTIAPIIKLIALKGDTIVIPMEMKKIEFFIQDDLSGIKSFKGYLNGSWILAEYDAKNNALYFPIDEHWPLGNIEFKLIITDRKKNTTEVTYQMKRI